MKYYWECDGVKYDTEAEALAYQAAHKATAVQEGSVWHCEVCGWEGADTYDHAKDPAGHSGPFYVLPTWKVYQNGEVVATFVNDPDAAALQAKAATPSVIQGGKRTTTATCSDGQVFSSEAAAKAHCDAASVRYTGVRETSVPYWATSDGQEFDSKEAADAHADALAPTASRRWDRDVAYWVCDGQEFSAKEAADAHAAGFRLGVEAASREVACFRTSDGELFDDEDSAAAWAQAHKVTASAASRDIAYWQVDGREFATEGEANAFADAAMPAVSSATREVAYYVASDGTEHATEDEAAAYVASTPIAVSTFQKDAPVEETGHYELVDAPAEAAGEAEGQGDQSAPADQAKPASEPKHMAGVPDASKDTSLPQTGDATLPAGLFAAVGAIASALGRRRRRH